ncbi:MAG: hypothetical protein WDO12_09960 [Pseudomonadota bacterium]
MLATEEDHLVPEQRVFDLNELRIVDARDVHAADLRAHRRRQWQRRDVPVGFRVVVELAVWMHEHFCYPRFGRQPTT